VPTLPRRKNCLRVCRRHHRARRTKACNNEAASRGRDCPLWKRGSAFSRQQLLQ
jgi:hypothetical protein